MGLKLNFGRQALSDLRNIERYLKDEAGISAANKVREHLRLRIFRLATLPWLGVQTRHPEIRRLSATEYPYLIYYTVSDQVVTILHIRHSSRGDLDLRKLLVPSAK